MPDKHPTTNLPPLILQTFGPCFKHLERTRVKGKPHFTLVFDKPDQRIEIGDANKFYNLRHVKNACYGDRGLVVVCTPKLWLEVMQQLSDGFLVTLTGGNRIIKVLQRYIKDYPVTDTVCLDRPFRKDYHIFFHWRALLGFIQNTTDWNISKGEMYQELRQAGLVSVQIYKDGIRKWFWRVPAAKLDSDRP